MKVSNRFVLVVIFLALGGFLYTQVSEKEKLIARKKAIEKEIEFTNKLLNDTRKKKSNSVNELRLLKLRIKKRNSLLNQLNEDIKGIDKEIEKNTVTIESLDNELREAKKEYADLIYHAFKNMNSQLNFMYLLASDNVNQAYSRFIYLQEYKKYREDKIKLIVALDRVIKEKLVQLKTQKEDKINLLNKKLSERALLLSESEETDNLIEKLKHEEGSLQQQLEEKQKIARKLEKEIEDLIRNEAKKNPYAKMTPAEKKLSVDFVSNMGRLPWPTTQGVVTSEFGEHPHPVLKDVKVRNNGIDISTVEGSKVRSVFEGVVSKIFTIKGANATVMVRHGNFYTVYHNLIDVQVKAGDHVSTKQIIGTVSTDPISGETIIHFELWKGLQIQNPEQWLSN